MPRKSGKAAVLELARKRFELCEDADKEQRQRELDDIKFYDGDQWPEEIRAARKGQPADQRTGLPPMSPRPVITINKTREPVWQVLNQERQSDIGVELDVADDFGDLAAPIDETEIELREGLYRRIQRSLEAADARTWAFVRATIAGRGYYGVMTRFLPGKTFDQEIYIHRYYNQACVSLDPSHEQPDGSDAEYGFVGIDMPWDEYKAEFPKVAKRRNYVATCSAEDFRALGDEKKKWFTTTGETRTVRVVDYWYTEREPRVLSQLADGSNAWKDELPADAALMLDANGDPVEREEVQKSIKWCKLDGYNDEPLDETDWPGPDIPIIKVLGEELQPYDSERRAEGMVRPMRGSGEGNNAMVSKLVETVAYAPMPVPQVTPTQIENFEPWYQKRGVWQIPFLPFNPDPMAPGPPPFVSASTPIEPIVVALQVFNEGIQSTSRVHDPSLGKVDPSLKSAKALGFLNAQSVQGTSNYFDNFKRSLRYEAQIVNNLMFPIYGTPGRMVRILTGENDSQLVRVNAPSTTQGQKSYTLTKDAKFNYIVKVTQNFDSRRTQEATIIGHLLMVNPNLLSWFGDLFFENQDGPGHQQMAERAKVMLDPKIQAMLQSKLQQSDVPPAARQYITDLSMRLQHAEQLLQQAHSEVSGKQMDLASKEKIAQLEIDSKERMAMADRMEAAKDREVKLATAEESAKVERMNLFLTERERLGVQDGQAADRLHEHAQGQLDNAHDAALSAMEHAQTMQQADQAHGHALEQLAAQPAPAAPTDGGTSAS